MIYVHVELLFELRVSFEQQAVETEYDVGRLALDDWGSGFDDLLDLRSEFDFLVLPKAGLIFRFSCMAAFLCPRSTVAKRQRLNTFLCVGTVCGIVGDVVFHFLVLVVNLNQLKVRAAIHVRALYT